MWGDIAAPERDYMVLIPSPLAEIEISTNKEQRKKYFYLESSLGYWQSAKINANPAKNEIFNDIL
jgi:hypothetical protein